MLFTIIIVSYNCEPVIRKTMTSLSNQTYKDYEVIIIDGGSNDRSCDMFREYEKLFASFILLSESDNGIYDAMNKGIDIANGEYIFFLNLGDTFFDKNVLNNVAKALSENVVDILYGDVIMGNYPIVQPSKLGVLFFLQEKTICHQSIFAKNELLKKNHFDIRFRMCADRVWLIKSLKQGATYKKVDLIVSNYDLGGQSSNYKNFGCDSIFATRECYGRFAVFFVRVKRFIGRIMKKQHISKGDSAINESSTFGD